MRQDFKKNRSIIIPAIAEPASDMSKQSKLYESYFGSPPADIWDFPPLHSNHLDQRRCYWQIPNPIYWVKKYLSLYLFHHSVGSKRRNGKFQRNNSPGAALSRCFLVFFSFGEQASGRGREASFYRI